MRRLSFVGSVARASLVAQVCGPRDGPHKAQTSHHTGSVKMARLLVALAAGASALRLAPTMTAAPPKTGAVLRRAAGAAALGGALLAGSNAALAAGGQPGSIYYKQLEDCATSKQFG